MDPIVASMSAFPAPSPGSSFGSARKTPCTVEGQTFPGPQCTAMVRCSQGYYTTDICTGGLVWDNVNSVCDQPAKVPKCAEVVLMPESEGSRQFPLMQIFSNPHIHSLPPDLPARLCFPTHLLSLVQLESSVLSAISLPAFLHSSICCEINHLRKYLHTIYNLTLERWSFFL